MSESINNFIFVPGLGADVNHPAGKLITKRIQEATRGAVTTELATTYDQRGPFHIPHGIDQQAKNIHKHLRNKIGRTAIFAHSLGCLPTVMALCASDSLRVDPANVILAGTPLNPDHSLSRLKLLLRFRHDIQKIALAEEAMPQLSGKIYGVTAHRSSDRVTPSRYDVLTNQFLETFPSPEGHLGRLQKLNDSTLLLSGKENVTDCTVENVRALFPNRSITTNLEKCTGSALVIEGADHNLKGYCEQEVPQIIFQKIPALGAQF